jgi:heterodisulfide reductase subunit B
MGRNKIFPTFPTVARSFGRYALEVSFLIVLDNDIKRQYVKSLEEELGITSEEGWKSIRMENLRNLNLPPNWRYTAFQNFT